MNVAALALTNRAHGATIGHRDSAVLEAEVLTVPRGGRNGNEVLRKVRSCWPNDDPEEILAILDDYGTGPHERGRERVHLASPKLSDGQRGRLPDLVSMAKADYRDALACAEYPEQMRLGFVGMRALSPENARAVRARDKKQYDAWLKG